ncbi:MAG: hypothetical protein EXR98_19540 [Gemmataceae bacterium]|nr:hypothetical protein [Gemmataceae bacterium]
MSSEGTMAGMKKSNPLKRELKLTSRPRSLLEEAEVESAHHRADQNSHRPELGNQPADEHDADKEPVLFLDQMPAFAQTLDGVNGAAVEGDGIVGHELKTPIVNPNPSAERGAIGAPRSALGFGHSSTHA